MAFWFCRFAPVPLVDMNRLAKLARVRKAAQLNNALDMKLVPRIFWPVQNRNAIPFGMWIKKQKKGLYLGIDP